MPKQSKQKSKTPKKQSKISKYRTKKTNKENTTKNPVGRPSKMPTFLKSMESVLNDGMNAIIMTDEELLMLANERLEDKEKVAERTFQLWKAGEVKSEDYNSFCVLYKKALSRQKNELFKGLKSEHIWQKYAWIIERKFADWNLKNINENNIKGEIQINTFAELSKKASQRKNNNE